MTENGLFELRIQPLLAYFLKDPSLLKYVLVSPYVSLNSLYNHTVMYPILYNIFYISIITKIIRWSHSCRYTRQSAKKKTFWLRKRSDDGVYRTFDNLNKGELRPEFFSGITT